MNRAVLVWLGLLAAVPGAALPVHAQDFRICEKESGAVAIAACDRAIGAGDLNNDRLAWAYHNRAVEYELMGENDKAIADYTQALKIDARRASSLVGRGNGYSQKGNYDRALTDYNAAIAIDPKDVNAFYNRGVAYERTKDFVKARADYERAIAMPAETVKHQSAQQLAREALKTIAGR